MTEKRNFADWLSKFRSSIANYGYYIDFAKVYRNVNDIKVELKVISDFQCARILQFIDAMPEGMKAAVHLKINFRLKNKDIAEILGISEEAANKRISRALNKIKKYMEDINNE